MRNDIHDLSNLQLAPARAERRPGGALRRATVSAALVAGFASGCLTEPEPELEPAEDDAADHEALGETAQALISFADLTLQNGWTHAPFSTRNAAISMSSDNIVRFRGAIASGTSPVAFTLPSAFRPATNVYVPVDLCDARKGRLIIEPSGTVSIQAEGLFSDAQCFTSLEGVSYLLDTPAHKLTLESGWVHGAYLTRDAGVSASAAGVVRFRGGIGNGTSWLVSTLPTVFRPAVNVYLPIDLSDGKKGRLWIEPSGAMKVSADGPFSDTLFTSLESVSFPLSTASFTPLALQNGWSNAPFDTRAAAVKNDERIVRFAGAIAGGANGVAFTLPPELRPSSMVYVHVDLCNARNGRLRIAPSGAVTIQAEGAFSDAQCFTSLEGAWYAL